MGRKHGLLRAAALFLSSLLLVLGGCSQKGGVDQDPGPTLTMDCLSEIGKTFDLIREENPDIEYQTVAIPDASGQCLGQAQGAFLYFFFGAQDFPSLRDISTEYGGQLKCAGIVSTVGEVYPETTDALPLEQFFSDHHISEYTYHLEERPDQGWIEFSCDGYLVWIDTNTGGEAEAMDPGWTILIIDEEVSKENYLVRDTYWNNHLESNLPK